MRKIISDNDGFKTIVEIVDLTKPDAYKQVRFVTEWDHARRDGSEQVQYTVVLSPEQRAALKEML